MLKVVVAEGGGLGGVVVWMCGWLCLLLWWLLWLLWLLYFVAVVP
jgi:hypothetical protein